MNRQFSLLATLLLAMGAASFAETAKEQEAKLLGVLKSNAELKEKMDACRQLQRIGTANAVPVLAGLLSDEKLAHMARYALEPIPSPAVDDAFRDALGKLKGRLQVGVIGSIGVRRDAKATDALIKLLPDSDPDVAQAAARSLGGIGTTAAAKGIEAALPNASPSNQLAYCEGLFRCAEALATHGERKTSLAIYDRLRGLQAPHQVRAAALRGAILLRGNDGLPLLLEAIRGNDFVMVEAAARIAMELPGKEVTKAVASELGRLPAAKQILFAHTLADRADVAALPALVPLTKSGEKTVRLAAIGAVASIGTGTAVPVFVELLGDADADIARAAQDALGGLSGAAVDSAIADLLKSPDAKTRSLAIDLLGQRRSVGAVPTLLKAARDQDAQVRVASLKALSNLADIGELPAMIDLLERSQSSAESQAAESVISAICARASKPSGGNVVIRKAVYGALPNGPQADVTKKVAELVNAGNLAVGASNDNFGDTASGTPKQLRVEYLVEGVATTMTVNEGEKLMITVTTTSPACADTVGAALAHAPASAKPALLRILRSSGGPKALAAMRAAAKDSTAEIQETALRALCDWPTADALPDVAELAKKSQNPTIQILALRGYVRMVGDQNVSSQNKVESLKTGLALAQRDEEKKLALAALGNIASLDSLVLVAASLDNPALKEEACLAAVTIAEKLSQPRPLQVAETMQRVVSATANNQLAQRAKALSGK